MRVEGARVHRGRPVPDVAQELGSREETAGIGCELREQLELLVGELQRDPADRRDAGDHVDREVARAPGSLRLQDGTDPLDQVVVEALFA